jgi:hypothetical protein
VALALELGRDTQVPAATESASATAARHSHIPRCCGLIDGSAFDPKRQIRSDLGLSTILAPNSFRLLQLLARFKRLRKKLR